jgi:outer membrane protein assembly factor BamB
VPRADRWLLLGPILAWTMVAVLGCDGSASDSVTKHPLGVPAARAGDSWTTYHHDAARHGYDALASPASGHLASAWTRRLDGVVYGQPLVVGGRVLVVTENDSVYALSTDGRVLWRRHLGTPVDLDSLPCGNIDPLGITSTPVYDAATHRLFVAAELRAPLRHGGSA